MNINILITMPNSQVLNTKVEDHRNLDEWSVLVGNMSTNLTLNESDYPIDMKFNDGHRLSITVYR